MKKNLTTRPAAAVTLLWADAAGDPEALLLAGRMLAGASHTGLEVVFVSPPDAAGLDGARLEQLFALSRSYQAQLQVLYTDDAPESLLRLLRESPVAQVVLPTPAEGGRQAARLAGLRQSFPDIQFFTAGWPAQKNPRQPAGHASIYEKSATA